MSWQSGFAIGWRKRIGARVSDDEWNGFWAALPENAKLTPAPDVNDVASCPRCKIPIKFSRKIKLRHFQKGQKPRTTAQFEKRRVCNGDCLGRECVIIVRSFFDAGFEAADDDDFTDDESDEEQAVEEAEVEAEAEAASEPAAPPTPSKVALEECSLHVRDADSPEPNQPKPRRRERKQRPVVILPFASAATSSAAAAGAAAAAGDDATPEASFRAELEKAARPPPAASDDSADDPPESDAADGEQLVDDLRDWLLAHDLTELLAGDLGNPDGFYASYPQHRKINASRQGKTGGGGKIRTAVASFGANKLWWRTEGPRGGSIVLVSPAAELAPAAAVRAPAPPPDDDVARAIAASIEEQRDALDVQIMLAEDHLAHLRAQRRALDATAAEAAFARASAAAPSPPRAPPPPPRRDRRAPAPPPRAPPPAPAPAPFGLLDANPKTRELEALLVDLGITRLIGIFRAEEIEDADLKNLDEDADLKELHVPFGPRMLLRRALERRKHAPPRPPPPPALTFPITDEPPSRAEVEAVVAEAWMDPALVDKLVDAQVGRATALALSRDDLFGFLDDGAAELLLQWQRDAS